MILILAGGEFTVNACELKENDRCLSTGQYGHSCGIDPLGNSSYYAYLNRKVIQNA